MMGLSGSLRKVLLAALVVAAPSSFAAVVVGLVDFDGTDTGLIGYSNNALATGGISTDGNLASNETFSLFASAGDAFNPMSRASLSPKETDNTQAGMPFNITDDSVSAAAGNTVFASDRQGFAGQAKGDGFFGITDNVNSSNPTGISTVQFVFNVAGFTNLSLAMDFAAMGGFSDEAFTVSYDIDGGGFTNVFTGSAVAGVSQEYTMDLGTLVTLTGPYAINGTTLTDNFQTLSAGLTGAGSNLTVRVTASFDGDEAIGFDNLTIRSIPEPTSLWLIALASLAALRKRRR